MAKHKNLDYRPEDIAFPNQMITRSELVGEMKSSYIEYAIASSRVAPCLMSVTVSSLSIAASSTQCMRTVSPVISPSVSAPPLSVTCSVAIIPTVTPLSTMRWCDWRRTFPSVIL